MSDQMDQKKERNDERPEDVEAHQFDKTERAEEPDVEGHVFEKADKPEMKE